PSWSDLDWRALLTSETAAQAVRATLLVGLGLLLAKLLSRAAVRVLRTHPPQLTTLVRRLVFGLVLGLFVAATLRQLGFELGVILGTAGVLSVAIGFASQTSMSNLISGVFLIFERPFNVGDVIRVGTTSGTVLSVDLLSVKLRTFDNTYVRIPNESMIKSEVTTLTRYPIRRIDLAIGVGYGTDLVQAERLLREIAADNPRCLEQPAPMLQVRALGDSSVDLMFLVWAARENLLGVQNELLRTILERFAAEGIEIPFPQRTLHWVSGSAAAAAPGAASGHEHAEAAAQSATASSSSRK
ncbi:MAG TPA: mechanosensitive ion channel family protein, partial [Thermoanaerobaculia bacterium]|nr:mechanosensitive ion channel family protein [Thermoanaerobaculia bacterium]